MERSKRKKGGKDGGRGVEQSGGVKGGEKNNNLHLFFTTLQFFTKLEACLGGEGRE